MSTVFRDRLKLLGDNADALAKWQAEAEQAEETTAHKQQSRNPLRRWPPKWFGSMARSRAWKPKRSASSI